MADIEQLKTDAYRASIEVIKEIGFFGYRSLITLNSGAFVVILTFVANSGENTAFELDAFWLKWSMITFLVGLALTFVSASFAYIQTQLKVVGRALPGGSSVGGHMAWLLIPVCLAFLAFIVGAGFAIAGISAK